MSLKILPTALLLVALVSAAQAQSTTAPPIAPPTATLYAHHSVNDTVELNGWMNTLPIDGDDTAMGPSGSCTQHTGDRTADEQILTVAGTAIDRTYTFNLTPTQPGVAKIQNGSRIVHNIFVGAGSCFGKVDLTSTLWSGDAKITEGKATGHWYDNNAGLYPLSKIESVAAVEEFPIEDLRWTINLKGRTGGSGFLGIGKDRGTTNVTLPLEAADQGRSGGSSQVIQRTIPPGEYVEEEYFFDDPTTVTYVYNWTAGNGSHTLRASGDLRNGTMSIRIAGPNGEIYNETVDDDFEESFEFNATAGNWTLQVSFLNTEGISDVSLFPTLAYGDPDPTPTTRASRTNETGGPRTDSQGGAPVPAWILVVGLVLAAAAMRRRN